MWTGSALLDIAGQDFISSRGACAPPAGPCAAFPDYGKISVICFGESYCFCNFADVWAALEAIVMISGHGVSGPCLSATIYQWMSGGFAIPFCTRFCVAYGDHET